MSEVAGTNSLLLRTQSKFVDKTWSKTLNDSLGLAVANESVSVEKKILWILTGKKHPKTKLQRLRKIRI